MRKLNTATKFFNFSNFFFATPENERLENCVDKSDVKISKEKKNRNQKWDKKFSIPSKESDQFFGVGGGCDF